MSKGKKLFSKADAKYGESFYILLLECLMIWGFIYYNTKFLTNFENLVEEDVMFPSKLIFFKSERINFHAILSFIS